MNPQENSRSGPKRVTLHNSTELGTSLKRAVFELIAPNINYFIRELEKDVEDFASPVPEMTL